MPIKLLLAAGLSVVLISGAAFAEEPFAFDHAPGQLPKTVVPARYDIALDVDLAKLRFAGHEAVVVDVRRPVSSITLNQAGLGIESARLDGKIGAKISENSDAETAILNFASVIAPGKHTLTVDWAGPVLTTPNGLYVDDYTGPDGKPHRMLVTQFEVADARRMFPGWDEPAFKAQFALTVTLPAGITAVSNMPIERETATAGGRQRIAFATTPRMSTYLLALVAGDLGSVRGEAAGTPVAVYAPSGREAEGRVALGDAEATLPYYNDYFGVRYPLPKLDMLAIPGNYEAGAMENWGALTYIDNLLLDDPRTGTPMAREDIYTVVAHEMAHQWSGDLVTMGWWDNIWLNEGFATWMENKAADTLHPKWDIWPRQHFFRERTLWADALASTHAVQQPIRDVSEADSAFDDISYGKGSLVIRMIEGWLGEDRFRDGMRAYMKAHAYGNTTSQDLWNALSSASGQDVAAVARGFIEQPGIPLLDVKVACRDGHATYTLTQGRFTIPAHSSEAGGPVWRLPLVYGGPGLPTRKLLVTDRQAKVTADTCGAPLKFDLGETTYARIRYDAAATTPLLASFGAFAPVDRANLLGDRFATFRNGSDTLGGWLDMTALLPKANQGAGETDIVVVEEMIDRITTLDRAEIGQPDRGAEQAYARRLLEPAYKHLGWDEKTGESPLDTTLRRDVLAALGQLGDADVLAEAKRRFVLWRERPDAVPLSLVEVVAPLAMRYGDAATWQLLADRLRAANKTNVKMRMLGAIAAARDPALIERNVTLVTGGVIPDGRIGRALALIANRSERPDLVFSLVRQRANTLQAHLSPGSRDRLLAEVAANSADPATADTLRSSAAPTTGAKVARDHAVDAIEARADLYRRVREQLPAWLSAHG